MRGLANDREITATLGVPVRWVEAQAWLVSGLLSGVSGLLLSDLVGLDAVSLTFLVISSLAAALIARLRSLVITFFAALVVGLVSALATPITSISEYRNMAPFVLATIALLVISRKREISFSGTGLGQWTQLRPRRGGVVDRGSGAAHRASIAGERIRVAVIAVLLAFVLLRAARRC